MKKGFTLLEMVIVISVLSVIFLLTVPNIQRVMRIIDKKGCDALVKVVDSAILQFKLEYDVYPYDVNDLVDAGLLNIEQTSCNDANVISIIEGKAYAK